MELSRPSITRLARKAGVKSISEECFNDIRSIITERLKIIIEKALIVNSQHQTKTLMPEDIYEGLSLMGENLARSHELGTTTITK
jgi:histone H3/H4